MASLKEVKNRISSVKSTRQITSAMKMVASAKLHKAQGRIENMLPYQRKLNEILTNFLRTDASFESPYTEKRPVTRVAVVAFSSNSSLCGAFNSNVAKMLERTLEGYQSLGKDISRWEKGGGSCQENGICAARQLSVDGRQAFVR